MASRPLIKPYTAIKAGDMSTTLVSDISIVDQISLISYSYSWTGTAPIGVVTVEVSNDYTQNAAGGTVNAGTWNSLPLSSTASISGNTGNGMIDIQLPGAYAVRTRYVPASGTGTLIAIIAAKVS